MRIGALLTAFLLTVGPNMLKFNFLGPQYGVLVRCHIL